jgi:hypothetical protein
MAHSQGDAEGAEGRRGGILIFPVDERRNLSLLLRGLCDSAVSQSAESQEQSVQSMTVTFIGARVMNLPEKTPQGTTML